MMPDTVYLYRLLGASASPGDTLKPSDLSSPKAYRQGMQRALIQRRPALYSRRWLCERLGISVWTCRRYDRQLGLEVCPSYYEAWLTKEEALALPVEIEAMNGVFLERADGQRFPPLRDIALSLMQRRWGVRLKRQHWNYYRCGSTRPIALPASRRPQPHIITDAPAKRTALSPDDQREKEHMFSSRAAAAPSQDNTAGTGPKPLVMWLCPDCLELRVTRTRQAPEPALCPKCKNARWEFVPESLWRDNEAAKTWWSGLWHTRKQEKRRARRGQNAAPPLPALTPHQAALAERLYSTVHRMDPDRALTRATAYDMVRKYDSRLVEWVIGLLGTRRNIYNPGGFVVTVLRSEHKYGGWR